MTAATRTPCIRPCRGPHASRRHAGVDPRLVVVLALTLPMVAALGGVVSVTVPDATIAEVAARPSEVDPGPIIHAGADGLTFSTTGTNQEVAWYAELTHATNNQSQSSAVIQGTTHTFLDWFYAKQQGAIKYTSLNATGAYDPNAGAYTVPFLWTKSSQGWLELTSYDGTLPTTPTTTTYYWAYNSVLDQYVFGATKNMASSAKVDPVSDTLGTNYQFSLDTNAFVVTAKSGSPQFLPTITQGVHFTLLNLPASRTWYVMMDPPDGVHEDTYGYVLRVTATGV